MTFDERIDAGAVPLDSAREPEQRVQPDAKTERPPTEGKESSTDETRSSHSPSKPFDGFGSFSG